MGCFWQPAFRAIGNFFRQNWRAFLQIAVTSTCLAVTQGAGGPACAALGSFAAGITSGNIGQALRGAAIAFVPATAFDVVGTATLGPGHPIPDFLSPAHLDNIAGHALVGCASAVVQGSRCGPGALAAAAGALAGPIIGKEFPNPRTNSAHLFGGTFASAIVGGIASVVGGGSFANGAVTSAFGYLYNQVQYIPGQEHPFAMTPQFKTLFEGPLETEVAALLLRIAQGQEQPYEYLQTGDSGIAALGGRRKQEWEVYKAPAGPEHPFPDGGKIVALRYFTWVA